MISLGNRVALGVSVAAAAVPLLAAAVEPAAVA
jgi:hypothetical protein